MALDCLLLGYPLLLPKVQDGAYVLLGGGVSLELLLHLLLVDLVSAVFLPPHEEDQVPSEEKRFPVLQPRQLVLDRPQVEEDPVTQAPVVVVQAMELEDELGLIEAEGGRADHDAAVVGVCRFMGLTHHQLKEELQTVEFEVTQPVGFLHDLVNLVARSVVRGVLLGSLGAGSAHKGVLLAPQLEPGGGYLRCLKEYELIVRVVIVAGRLVEPACLAAVRADYFALDLVDLRLVVTI